MQKSQIFISIIDIHMLYMLLDICYSYISLNSFDIKGILLKIGNRYFSKKRQKTKLLLKDRKRLFSCYITPSARINSWYRYVT